MLYSTIQWDLKIGVGVFLEVTKNNTIITTNHNGYWICAKLNVFKEVYGLYKLLYILSNV